MGSSQASSCAPSQVLNHVLRRYGRFKSFQYDMHMSWTASLRVLTHSISLHLYKDGTQPKKHNKINKVTCYLSTHRPTLPAQLGQIHTGVHFVLMFESIVV